jgi:hypothetical protein
MALSSELISQFVNATKEEAPKNTETTVFGTIVELDGKQYMRMDGSDLLTPLSTTVSSKNNERVVATIKNHALIVTGNITSPSARNSDVDDINDEITNFEIAIGYRVTAEDINATNAIFENLRAKVAKYDDMEAVNAVIDSLSARFTESDYLYSNNIEAVNADIDNLIAELGTFQNVSTDDLEAMNADIGSLRSYVGEFTYLSTDVLTALKAEITEILADKLSVNDADIRYANIDFTNIGKAAMEYLYSHSGLIRDVIIGEGTITGHLVGVTISGDLIEGNTVKADKLVIRGSDGLYYKLNTDGMVTEAEQTDQNSLNGSVIKAKSITATKISVSDLVAFDATIGGFKITEKALYSGVKETATNTTRGVYLDSEGQMSVGDSNRYLRYYKKTDGTYALEVSADIIRLNSKGQTVEEALDSIEVGGRNLLLNSDTRAITPYSATTATHESNVEVTEWNTSDAKRMYGTCGDTSFIFATLGGTSRNGASIQDQSYSATIYIKNNHATNSMAVSANHGSSLFEDVLPGECKRVELVGPGNGWGYLQFNFKVPVAGDEYDITYWHPKIELGNKPTDWSPAPEDMATNDTVDEVASSVEANQQRITDAEALIELLSESISMLVTDGNGASLMTQTDNGWTFSTGNLQDAVNRTSEALDTLTHDVGDVNSAVDILQQAVRDLGTLSDYIKIGTYEDEPCIELGESDSDFKLLITNTRIMFKEGTGVPAYFTNQSMHIKKAVVEEELQQGGFVWKARANGNLGLVWKGVTS